MKTSYCWSTGNMELKEILKNQKMCDFSLEKNVHYSYHTQNAVKFISSFILDV